MCVLCIFPGGSDGKEPPCKVADLDLISRETKGVERQGESVLTGEWGAGIGWTRVFRGYIGARKREEIEDSRK